MSALDPRFGRWLLWLVPFTVLVLAIGLETGWGNEVRPSPLEEAPVTPAPVTTAVAPEFRIEGGLESMKATVERPLFNATRRPAPSPVAEAAKPTIQRGQFLLTGTMITEQGAVAYLKEASGTGKARSVKKGDTVNGMLVAEVKSDRIKLTLGDESEDLELKVAKGPKTTLQPAPAAPAAPGAPGAQPPPQGTGVPPVAGAPQRRPQTQATQGPSDDARENTRAARRAARAAEMQQQQQQQGGTPATGSTQAPQTNTWQDTYQRMQRRPR